MIRNKLLIISLLMLVQVSIKGQTSENPGYEPKIFPMEKLYLHTDREFYFVKEDIWFSAYLIDGATQKRLPGYRNMIVELVDEKGNVALKKIYAIGHGLSSGNISLTDSLRTGKYMLRAHTDFQAKLGEETYFYKPLSISKNLLWKKEQTPPESAKQEKPRIDLSFMPEGGFAITGIPNTFAFKAIDTRGKTINISGKIIDSDGNLVTTFKTDYRGMGKLIFTPGKGKTYRAMVEGYPEINLPIANIQEQGTKIQIGKRTPDQLDITINTSATVNQNLYLACMFRGNLIFANKIFINAKSKTLKVNPNILNGGINRFVLLDAKFEPISERLVFSDHIEKSDINIQCSATELATRSLIKLELQETETQDTSIYSNLSLAVVSNEALNASGEGMNMLSWSLINSELHNFAEPSLNYFENDSLGNSEDKLDLLMLTHGWSNYVWNMTAKPGIDKEKSEIPGLTLSGSTKHLFNKNPLENASVILSLFKSSKPSILTGKTGPDGRFSFPGILFTDTAKVFLQVKNNRGKNLGEVFLDPFFPPTPTFLQEKRNWLRSFDDIPLKLHKQKYLNELALTEFDPGHETILLTGVDITGKKNEPDDELSKSYGFYSFADQQLVISENDRLNPDVLLYLSSHVAGLRLQDNSISFTRNQGLGNDVPPSFIIDGIHFRPEEGIDMVRSMTMNDIKRIDVIKNQANLTVHGGGNGVIAIYTRNGDAYNLNNEFMKGTILQSIVGYSPFKEFYSPQYTPENVASPVPDRRITLFWKPQLVTEKGKASVSFYTSDNLSDYTVFVEGINSQGKVCLGKVNFSVTKLRSE